MAGERDIYPEQGYSKITRGYAVFSNSQMNAILVKESARESTEDRCVVTLSENN